MPRTVAPWQHAVRRQALIDQARAAYADYLRYMAEADILSRDLGIDPTMTFAFHHGRQAWRRYASLMHEIGCVALDPREIGWHAPRRRWQCPRWLAGLGWIALCVAFAAAAYYLSLLAVQAVGVGL